jgi:hypothetical protein
VARRLIFGFGHSAPAAVAFVCGTLLACAGKSVRDEDGEARNDAGTGGDPSPGRGGGLGNGGTSGGGRGGTTGAGGSKATGGSAGKSTGGAAGAASGGTSGSATGGTSGSAGSSGTNTCTPCTPAACSTVPIPTSTINDFENLLIDAAMPTTGIYGVNDATGMPKPEWWLGYFSGSFAYPIVPEACTGEPVPAYPLAHTDTDGVLRVTGTVGTYSGFGIWLGQCIVDMSAYSGISFRIGGNAGPGEVEFRVVTNANAPPVECLVGKGECADTATGGCSAAGVPLVVPETPEIVSVRFETLIGGSPEYDVNPAEVLQLTWAFAWGDATEPYDVDVTVDDVVLFD